MAEFKFTEEEREALIAAVQIYRASNNWKPEYAAELDQLGEKLDTNNEWVWNEEEALVATVQRKA
jgi:hypothetical protein